MVDDFSARDDVGTCSLLHSARQNPITLFKWKVSVAIIFEIAKILPLQRPNKQGNRMLVLDFGVIFA
jgi:hypothetical protein